MLPEVKNTCETRSGWRSRHASRSRSASSNTSASVSVGNAFVSVFKRVTSSPLSALDASSNAPTSSNSERFKTRTSSASDSVPTEVSSRDKISRASLARRAAKSSSTTARETAASRIAAASRRGGSCFESGTNAHPHRPTASVSNNRPGPSDTNTPTQCARCSGDVCSGLTFGGGAPRAPTTFDTFAAAAAAAR